ncbi:hypothetical protein INT45_000135 [Circinella minor]|uniref:SWIM-type domain-containing protein n=1 Tax=Circinella minor TaxID=1195481 RepID=A0A8H7VKN4_9FUNG|nr:hypothetical protein INT45_000135 [Circinella minor]
MDAILSTFGTEVQVLVCHWHIRRAWEKKVRQIIDRSKARLVLQILKLYVKKACVYLSSLMYAKDPEDFEEGAQKSFKEENIYYEIVVREGVLHSCTCPDFYFNRILCKHIFLCNRVRDIPLHRVGISRSIQSVRPVNEADNDKIEEIEEIRSQGSEKVLYRK